MQVQLFTNDNFGEGWFVGTAPTINANWLASGKETWTLPVGGHAGQLVKLGGKVPVNRLLGACYNALRPEGGPDWQLRFPLAFLY